MDAGLAPVQQPSLDIRVQLEKPSRSKSKCSIGTSFAINQNRAGIVGMCIRDEIESFVLPRTEWHSPIISVDEGEAGGLLSSIHWVHHLHLDEVIFLT